MGILILTIIELLLFFAILHYPLWLTLLVVCALDGVCIYVAVRLARRDKARGRRHR